VIRLPISAAKSR